jgi:hypothetical protein
MMTTMPNSLPEALLLAAVSFLAGFAAGQPVEFRRDKATKKVHVKVDPHPLSKYFNLFIITLILVGVGFLVNFTVDQRQCNGEFQRTIRERADVSVTESAARVDNDEAVRNMVVAFLAITPGPDASERSRQVLQTFDANYMANVKAQQAAAQKRADNPYPHC